MADPITSTVSDRICKHMNEDHSEAIAVYAQVFGNTPTATTAKMLSIDPQGMNLSAEIEGEIVPIRIEFDHILQDSEDAHHTLIEMVKQGMKIVRIANLNET
jgi:putative heme iron utilization protein